MRPPSFKMELPPPDHQHDDIKSLLPLPPPPAMPPHDQPIEVNQIPPARPSLRTAADSDETEYSTSFADTASTNLNNSSTLSDTEVDSKLHTHANAFSSPFDEFGTAFRARKKKLTSHWRSFIRPVIWRCKWAELKIKQFESQALKYTKTIAALGQNKHLANQSIPEGFSTRSMPFTSQRRRSKLMKRRKRVRVEDKMDAKIYMSKHILFSYHENSKLDLDGISMTDDVDDLVVTGQKATSEEEVVGFDNKWSFLEDKDNNNMEGILRKIDKAQTRVQKLKAQLDVVISEENIVDHFEAQTSSSPTFSTCNRGGDSVVPVVSSCYGEAAGAEDFHIPDIIESTEALLPSSVSVDVVVTHHHHHLSQVADSSCENIVDNMVVVHNQDAEAEKNNLRNCQQQLVVKLQQQEEAVDESEAATKDMMTSSFASGFQIPKNKRKRGDRKAGTGNWSRHCPAEPADDSH